MGKCRKKLFFLPIMRFFSTARKYVPAYGGEGSDRLVEPGSVAKRIFLPTQVSLVVHARKAK
jgi:hypothetical protein